MRRDEIGALARMAASSRHPGPTG